MLHEKGLLVRLFTQNIDTMERLAGIPPDKVVEAHGTFADAHCIECKSQHRLPWYRKKIDDGEIPRCSTTLPIPPPELPPTKAALETLSLEIAQLKEEKGKYLLTDMNKCIKLGMEVASKEKELAAGLEAIAEYPSALALWQSMPKTKICNGLVKADITMFGEPLPKRFRYRMEQDCADADLLIVIGSSLQVMPFAGILGT